MASDKKRLSCIHSPFAKAVSICSSLRFAVVLLIIIALASVTGTIFPQNPDGSVRAAGSLWEKVLLVLELDNIFRSSWFFLLGLLLCTSLILCSWKRFRTQIRASKTRGLLFRRGDIPRLGSLLIHIGAVTVICGFVYGQCRGINAYVEIPEGETVPLATVIPGRVSDTGLSLRCEDFSVEYYDSGMPREFRSDIEFISDGAPVEKGTLLVNHPIIFQGIRYYQANYRIMPIAAIEVKRAGQSLVMTAQPGEVHAMDKETFFRVSRVEENFMDMGPAMKIDFFSPEQSGYVWVLSHIEDIEKAFPDLLSRAPQFNPARFEGYEFSLEGIEPKYVTGLSISYDPGLPVVILGILLFLSGLFLAYLVPGTRIRALVRPSDTEDKP